MNIKTKQDAIRELAATLGAEAENFDLEGMALDFYDRTGDWNVSVESGVPFEMFTAALFDNVK